MERFINLKHARTAMVNQSDFVHVPKHSLKIAKEQGFNGFDWENTHYELYKSGLYMPPASMFTSHLLNVIKAREKDMPLYDGNRNKLIKNEVKKMYRILTSSCRVWLDNFFKVDGTPAANLLMEYEHRVVDGKLSPQHIKPLEQHIMEYGVLVDLKFNNQGFPIKKSAEQKYKQGKNLYLYQPSNGSVAWFGAGSGRASLDCGGDPAGSYSVLGVFACAEGAQKNLDVSSHKPAGRTYSIPQIKSILAEKRLQGLVEEAILDGLEKIKE